MKLSQFQGLFGKPVRHMSLLQPKPHAQKFAGQCCSTSSRVCCTGMITPLMLRACCCQVVLYFYPADASPGCTKQANAFKESISAFKKAGSVGAACHSM